MVRAYYEKVIRPEYYSLVCQIEQGLKQVNEGVFHVRRELTWMASENRTAQRHACGTQLLTVGWPTGMPPQDRIYMVTWILSQVPAVMDFLKFRRYLDDQNAHELGRFLNALTNEPTAVPQGGDFWSSMTMLSFKSFEMRKAVLEKFGGSSGLPLYKDESTPVHNKHIKLAPCSPQWQRKLEAPLRVVLACVNSHPDYNATSRMVILWKTLQDQEFHPDIAAWARVHYFQEGNEFKGRLEITRELEKIVMSAPADQNAQGDAVNSAVEQDHVGAPI